ncbi:MAG: TylF/MycF/NovP-related O-methyltransferase [Sulfurimicrobium sp.]|nr:TylF/MycF/NovP-related O-methyltransferase [Sulfurimicrobium sp.]
MYLKKLVKKIAQSFGLEIVRVRVEDHYFPDVPAVFVETYKKVQPYTMTSPERIISLCEAVKYVQDKNIEGDIVECGVWKGGSMMAVAEILLRAGDTTRDLYLFDTFEGMPPPTVNDVDIVGVTAESLLDRSDKERDESVWCRATLDVVRKALGSTGYPSEKVHFIKGMVEETIPHFVPAKIALLRLDTDWYESTKHEMEHLFPRLSKGGVLIIDDYGHWQGARKAVDEYLEKNDVKILLNRIDYTGRIAVKVD